MKTTNDNFKKSNNKLYFLLYFSKTAIIQKRGNFFFLFSFFFLSFFFLFLSFFLSIFLQGERGVYPSKRSNKVSTADYDYHTTVKIVTTKNQHQIETNNLNLNFFKTIKNSATELNHYLSMCHQKQIILLVIFLEKPGIIFRKKIN